MINYEAFHIVSNFRYHQISEFYQVPRLLQNCILYQINLLILGCKSTYGKDFLRLYYALHEKCTNIKLLLPDILNNVCIIKYQD